MHWQDDGYLLSKHNFNKLLKILDKFDIEIDVNKSYEIYNELIKLSNI